MFTVELLEFDLSFFFSAFKTFIHFVLSTDMVNDDFTTCANHIGEAPPFRVCVVLLFAILYILLEIFDLILSHESYE